ncbi:MAG TPA: NDP-sugar synthase [Armatimonadota bacterium]|nr:NDP-sugar synthase [Armatimonadota bacterium]
MPSSPRAMILAAGGGTRLHPLTFAAAKPMAPVLNRPVMEHILARLRRHGVTDVIANLHHYGEQVASYFGDGERFGVSLRYSREQELLGTAGGVKHVAGFFRGETFFVIGGDDLADFDLGAMLAFHRRRGALATIAVVEVAPAAVSHYGIVVAGSRGRIRSFQEKPPPREAQSRMANTGVYLFEREVLDHIPPREFFDFGRQVFPLLLQRGAPFYAWQADGYWKDVGSPREYLEANLEALAGKAGLHLPGAEVSPGIRCEGKVRVEGAAIAAPAVLGSGCRLAAGCAVRGSVIGPRARIPAGARLERCVVWGGVEVGDIEARDAVFGPGCVVWV